MKNTFWKRERIEIMIALALFNYVFLGAEYLFDNMMAFQTDSGGVVLAQSYVLGSSTVGFLLLAYWMVNCGKEQRRQAVLVPESSRLYVFGGSRYIRVMEAYLPQD